MLELKDVRGGYDKTLVIDNINLRIVNCERVALLGRNGVGKTTLLKYIMGLLNFACGFISMSDI